MISRISVVRQMGMRPAKKGGRGGIWESLFAPGGGYGGGWSWTDLIGSALNIIPRIWNTPEPGGFAQGGPPATIPQQQYPAPVLSPPVIGFPYPTPRDIGPRSTGARIARQWMAGNRKLPRHMHYCNQKALNRAIRRIKGFQHLVKKSHVFSTLTAHGPVHRRHRKCQ